MGEDRVLKDWDAKKGYEGYYPDPELAGQPTKVPGEPDFMRYTLKNPTACKVQPVAGDNYRFSCPDAPGDWIDAMRNMVHDKANDILVGVSANRNYVVTIGGGSPATGLVEASFFLEDEQASPPVSLTMIGHAHF